MAIERENACDTTSYRGHKINVHFIGPDYSTSVDGAEMPNYAINMSAAIKRGMKYVDEIEKEKEKEKEKQPEVA